MISIGYSKRWGEDCCVHMLSLKIKKVYTVKRNITENMHILTETCSMIAC